MKTSLLPPQITNIPESIGSWKSHVTKKRLVGGIVVVVLAAIIFSGVFNKHTNAKVANNHAPVLTVTMQPASIKSMDHVLAVHGTISAWDPISIGATTSGLEVKRVLVDEGQLVKRGQALAILDAEQLQAQLESEEARLAASVASISKSIQPNRPEDINGLIAAVSQAQANVGDQEAGLIQARANLENARINSKRYQLLHAQGAVSAQEAETRETNTQVCEAAQIAAEKRVKAAEYALKQSQERLSMAQTGGRKEDIQIAKANAAEIRANIKRLKTQIDQTSIRAPIDGLITRRDVHLGDIATSGKTMFLMARDNRLELKAQVPENDLALVKSGQKVIINSSAAEKIKIEGKVREISPLVDADSRLATVRIDVPNNSGLKQGMYAEGKINVGKELALAVPSPAVINRDEKNTVFVLHNDQVESRPVIIGSRNSDFVQINSGLSNKELIVIDGAGFLKDGDYVSVAH